jgi:subtilisin family serine protease
VTDQPVSDDRTDDEPAVEHGVSRRTLLQATGAVAGAGVLGIGGVGDAAAASGDVEDRYRNWRAWEATHAWERGYRGRTDRTISLTDTGIEARHPDDGPWNGVQVLLDDGNPTLEGGDPFAFVDGTVEPTTPKTVGWYDAGDRYGNYDKPRDPNGHGSHVTSIMGGTGQAGTVDRDTVTQEEPRTFLSAVIGNELEYEVDARAGTGVYGSAYGELIEVRIEGPDGKTRDTAGIGINDSSTYDNNVAVAPAAESGTFTIYVQAAEGETASTAYVESVNVGAFQDPQNTVGDRTADGGTGIHTGLAPNQSVVGLQGLSQPTVDLGNNAEWFAETFNMRAVNMSWGYIGGLPIGAAGGAISELPSYIKDIAEGGILTVAAAGNSATPANGNGAPAAADEAISVVATGPRDGISGYSSGGIGAVDEDEIDDDTDGAYMKPDVTAPGGTVTDLVNAVEAGDPTEPESNQDPIRDYTGIAGTSMASPYTNGIAGLVANAMEFDAPDSISLPEPAATGLDDVLRLKQVLLATATETVFTAAPYHRAHAPAYDFGGRDPYEGYGRVNPGPALDAVARELTDGTTTETTGLRIPDDERAAAGYVESGPGAFDVSVSFSHYSGGDQGQAKGDPHIDLFVYDAETPAEHGEPNVVARDAGLTGAPSVSVTTDEPTTYYVVAKLVNVPGGLNGDDIQAHFDLTLDIGQPFTAAGTRTDDGSVFTGGQTDEINLSVEASEAVELRDVVPIEWNVLTDYGDVESVDAAPDKGVQYVYFTGGTGESVSATYFAEAPDETTLSNAYTFGPAEVSTDGDTWYGVSGTSDTNLVVGQESSY